MYTRSANFGSALFALHSFEQYSAASGRKLLINEIKVRERASADGYMDDEETTLALEAREPQILDRPALAYDMVYMDIVQM